MSPQELKNKKLVDTFQALIKLLQTKDLAAITVTELCAQAQVSRTYYYRRFTSPEDVISQFEILSIVQYMRGLPRRTKLSVATMIGHYFQLAADMAEAQLVLITAGKEAAVIKAFKTAFLYLLQQDLIAGKTKRITQKYWAEFIAGAVINMSVRWLQEGQQESPAYMGKLVAGFLHTLN